MLTFSEILKEERLKSGRSQLQMANLLGVSPRAVWQWEQGKHPHLLTQEGVLARLTKAKQRTQGTNGMDEGLRSSASESTTKPL